MGKALISSLEYEALKNLEQMVRIAMQSPDAAEGVVTALQALNAIRRDEAGDAAAPFDNYSRAIQHEVVVGNDLLAADLIERAMKREVE